MRKRIAVEDLRLGMHVEELCGSWMDHPFWRTRFTLADPSELQRVQTCGIREVWIDTSKGLDVTGDAGPAVSQADVDASVDDTLATAAAELAESETGAERDLQCTLSEELSRAADICDRAKPAVISMFREARMGKAIDADQALSLVEEISGSVMRNSGALINLARLKSSDDYTYMHSVAVCALMVALARQLKLPEDHVRQAGMAGLLHDVGKALVPSAIINKPGKLTDEEFVSIRKHPELGHRLLQEGRGVDEIALDVCLHHHEKIDGSGYPHKLKDEQISLFAKMGAICDVYDAVTSNRSYKSGWNPAESIRKMSEWSQSHFDHRIFHAFVKSIGIYPLGSLVRMESERLAVVIEQNKDTLVSPRVKVFFSIARNIRITPQVIDLAQPGVQDRIIGREPLEHWQFQNLDRLWTEEAGAKTG